MIPVFQNRSVANDGSGNCFNACIASILERPLREVAPIHPDHPAYWQAWYRWFGAQGLKMTMRGGRNPPKGYSIVAGRSSRLYPDGHAKAGQRIHHACVAFDGVVVHDPFPVPGGFDEVSHYWVIEPMTEVERAYFDAQAED